MNTDSPRRGVAAIELMAVVAVLLAAATVAVPLFLHRFPVQREGTTRELLRRLHLAITGDASLRAFGGRSSFGFVGDLGMLPADLGELVDQGGYPPFQQSQHVWFGWHGPYLTGANPTTDAWGNPVAYLAGSGSVVRELRSAGADGVLATADDLVEPILRGETDTALSGEFWNRDRSSRLTESGVTIHYPQGLAGLVTQQITPAPPQQGYDSLTDPVADPTHRRIPVGIRYLETTDHSFRRLVALNGGEQRVDFIGEGGSASPLDENDYDSTAGLEFHGGGDGAWKVSPAGDAYLYYQANRTREGERLAAFGQSSWTDYQVQMEVELLDDRRNDEGFALDYRTAYPGAGTTPSQGYRLSFYPEPQAPLRLRCLTLRRFPVDFAMAQVWAFPVAGFGRFRFTAGARTMAATIEHTLRIETVSSGVYTEVFARSFSEPRTLQSSLAGRVGFLVWGGQECVRIYRSLVSSL